MHSELRLISSGCRNAATAAICTTLSVADAVASVGRSIHIALRQVPARETSGDLLSLDSKLHIEQSFSPTYDLGNEHWRSWGLRGL